MPRAADSSDAERRNNGVLTAPVAPVFSDFNPQRQMLCILKTVIAWVILLLVGTNLIGLVVRGLFWSPPSIDATTDRVKEVLQRESSRTNLANRAITHGAIFGTAAYLFALFYFWNIGLALAGGLVIGARIPDLTWELRTGNRVSRNKRPKGPVYFVASTVLWGTLVLVWYSLCRWPS